MFFALLFALLGIVFLLTTYRRSSYVYRVAESLNRLFEPLYATDPQYPAPAREIREVQESEVSIITHIFQKMDFMPDSSVTARFVPLFAIACLFFALVLAHRDGVLDHREKMTEQAEFFTDLQQRMAEKSTEKEIMLRTLNERGGTISEQLYRPVTVEQ